MRLHFRKYGQGPPLIILHGLFGSSDNWHTLARRWGVSFTVYALDQRNHGSSPHESTMNYDEMVQDLIQFIKQEKLETVNIIGHSMGGKVAMQFASQYGDVVNNLVVLDIGVGQMGGKHAPILKALETLNLDEYDSRDAVQKALEEFVESESIRQFLQKNVMRRVDGSYSWKFNRAALLDNYEGLIAGLDLDQPFLGPVLFLRGEYSDYLEPELSTELLQPFPLAQMLTIAGGGHWLHAEQPDAVFQQILDFFLE